MQTKNYKDFCPTIQTRIIALIWWFFGECRQFFLATILVRAEILVILGLHFWRNDDLINSFWIQLTFNDGHKWWFEKDSLKNHVKSSIGIEQSGSSKKFVKSRLYWKTCNPNCRPKLNADCIFLYLRKKPPDTNIK